MTTILIVDDQPDNLYVLERLLKGQGYTVIQASTGEDALEVARSGTPDLMLLDVMMPGMDGFAVARELRANPSTAAAKILFCTARGGIDARLLGREAGGDAYIVKPFVVERLVAQASNMLGVDPLGF